MLIKASRKFQEQAQLTPEKYKEMYQESIENPELFWSRQAERLTWSKKWQDVKSTSFDVPVNVQWFQGGELNVSYNCVDRHVDTRGDKTAILWESDSPDIPSRHITYRELFNEVNRFAHALKTLGVERQDRVIIYMPMIPETAFAMLACARLGAIHSVVFGGFSPDAIADRIADCEAKWVITADGGFRGGKVIPLKANVDEALKKSSGIKKVLTLRYANNPVLMKEDRDIWYRDVASESDIYFPPQAMRSEDPLFILYTSGSTNKPKGVMHATGGYLVYASLTHQYVFDAKENDIFWCSADVGWITGHSYIIYGPLSNGATTLMYEGVPNYPTPSRFWEVIDKHKVTVFYTAPTAIRSLMREGNQFVQNTSRKSLRLLGSVGEPINPEAWMWYYNTVGEGRCPIVDTWWQTETGGVLIVPLPGASLMKPGAACFPFFGVQPELLTAEGQVIEGAGEGVLVLKDSWPGQMISIYGNHSRFEETYFSSYRGRYFTGDGCRRDEDGCYWITGRVDDVINVSGHRIGTAEVESAFVAHPKVAEAAVVGVPHEVKGQALYVYISLKAGEVYTDVLKAELRQWVRKVIGPIATPDNIQWAPRLPKTRSGKIMRRILRKIAEGQYDSLGDISTLSDPAVVNDLISDHIALQKKLEAA
jgi:acetyl-CoA synthetase